MTGDSTRDDTRPFEVDASLDGLSERASRGGKVLLWAQAYRFLFQLASSALMARLLVPEDFGVMAMAMAITAIVGMFSDMGLSSATVQKQNLNQNIVSGLMLVGVLIGLALMLIAFLLAPLAALIFTDDRVTPVIILSAITIPIGALSAQPLALMSRHMEFAKIQGIFLSSLTFSMSAALFCAWYFEMGYWALVLNTWLNTLMTGALVWSFSTWRPSRVTEWQGVKESVNFGISLTAASLVDYLHRQSDNVLVGWKHGAESLGYYSRAYGLFMLPTMALIYPFFELAKPILSRALSDEETYRVLFHRMLLPLNMLSGLLAGLLYVLAPIMIFLLYGDQWSQSVPLFRALSLCLCIQGISISLGWIYISMGRGGDMFRANALSGITFLIVFVVAVQISLEAVALAYALVSIALLLPMIWLAVRDSPFALKEFLWIHLPVPVCSALALMMTVASFDLSGRGFLGHLFGAAVFSLFYLVCLGVAIACIKPLQQVMLVFMENAGQWISSYLSRREPSSE